MKKIKDEAETPDYIAEPAPQEETVISETAPVKVDSGNDARIFVYLGPTIRGIIVNGAIFAGTRAEVLKRFERGIEKYSQIERLIVADRNVAATREKLARQDGAVYVAYQRLAELISKEV